MILVDTGLVIVIVMWRCWKPVEFTAAAAALASALIAGAALRQSQVQAIGLPLFSLACCE